MGPLKIKSNRLIILLWNEEIDIIMYVDKHFIYIRRQRIGKYFDFGKYNFECVCV